ncbi:arginine--tRNA ligase [Cytobacillus solani]|uniref:Arginine--tRNA ligase n=1 Tax=Cytobacillus solani TaxID=1637975 RepID=A0A0Q3SJ19_9BACI|nr:arginine--tRNA ligase [Cytobacillus solani]KOP82680.1 arginine--tRNA ligase [Bacillus sp. FJAT-21945]KQL19692.1 arginine--tRNA ligase [Cytobacillus solani]
MDYKMALADVLYDQLKDHLKKSKLLNMIEIPKFANMGDLAFPCFELANIYRKSPQNIALELVQNVELSNCFQNAVAASGYINVFLNKSEVSSRIIQEVISRKEKYGDINIGNQNVITIDFSSPNIAKPFSMGHLRSTVIGNALALLSEKCGYKPIRINHLGDWGTQFGKLIVAYKKWGEEQKVRQNPIKELLKLYIQFHEEAEQDTDLNDQGRLWFKRLEEGNEEALELWKWFRDESLKEFSKIYTLLGVNFDSTHGEAFYNDKMEQVVHLLDDMQLLKESEGAKIVEINNDSPPCLIKKKDGTTLYATRDLAAAIYRQNHYGFVKSLYVVGNEQTLHFKQLFEVLMRMGYTWHEGLMHIPFGMMLKDGKKMSTRKGKVVLLEQVLIDAINIAKKNIIMKNPELEYKDTVARQVGVGAVIFHDLKNDRLNNIEFSIEDMLRFEGETGPYVQYTHARASSILKKGKYEESNEKFADITDDEAWSIIKNLMAFPVVIKRAFNEYDPSQIAKYVLELSKAFNKYYGSVRILDDHERKQARLSLVFAVQIVLKEGLRLLGIEAPKEM